MARYKRVLRLLAGVILVGGMLPAQHPAAMDQLDEAAAKADELSRSGRFSEATEVMKPAVRAAEAAGPGSSHRLAWALTLLGTMYANQCRYAEAERHLRRAMDIWENNPASNMGWRLLTAKSLAAAYSATGRFALSESLLRKHLSIGRNLNAGSPEIAKVFQVLGNAQEGQGRYAEAESSYRASLAIFEKLTGYDDDVAHVLSTLGDFQLRSGRHREALGSLERSLAIYGRLYSEARPDTLEPSLSLARLYVETDRPLEAERVLRQAHATANATVGPDHPFTGIVIVNYASVLRVLGRRSDSARLEREGKAILENFSLMDPSRYTVDVSELIANQGRR